MVQIGVLQVVVELPDVKGRKEILDYYLAGKPLAPDVDSELVARRTPGQPRSVHSTCSMQSTCSMTGAL